MNIVHVAAHQDDEGHTLGTLLKYRQQGGHHITLICTTNGDKGMSFSPEIPYSEAAAIRDREMRAVAEALGADYVCLGAEDEFLYDTKEMRLRLMDALRAARAELIFTHWVRDYNLDHTTTSRLVFQMSMNSIIASMKTEHPPLRATPKIFYWDVGDGFGFEGTHFVELPEELVREKVRILRLHASQMEVMRKIGPDFADLLYERARAVGQRVGVPFAEVFRPCLASRRTPLASMLP
jgi:LmbE family N-acetylglucosaminyl deacetylase